MTPEGCPHGAWLEFDGAVTRPPSCTCTPSTAPVWLWNKALRDCLHPGLTLTVKGMGWLLSTYAKNEDGTNVYPSRATVAERANITRAAKVDPHVERLIALGWLAEVGTRYDGVKEYRLTVSCLPQKGQQCPHKGQPLPQKGTLTK
jgi:hypothetical protein